MDRCGIERGEFWNSGDDVTSAHMCDTSMQLMGHRMSLQRFSLVIGLSGCLNANIGLPNLSCRSNILKLVDLYSLES